MGVPNSEVGYTSAMPRREDHEVRQGHVGHWIKKKTKNKKKLLKNTPMPNLIKIRLMEAELFHADRQTDRQT